MIRFFQVTPSSGVPTYTWVTFKEPKTKTGLLKSLPITGSRFYHTSCVTFAMNRGIITYENLGQGFECSGSLPHDYLRQPLQLIEECWDKTSEPVQKKRSINSLLGLSR